MKLDPRQLDELRQKKEERFSRGEKKRVAPLMRVSTHKQANSADTIPIPVQREQLMNWINQNPKWEPAMVNGELLEYTEVVSAYKVSREDRELIKKSLRDGVKDLYDIIVFFKHDRLSRISEEYMSILKDYWDMGIEPWDYEKRIPLVMKTPTDKLVRSIEGHQAESESFNTSFRVTEFMRSYAEDGLWMGGKAPYGYQYKEPSIIKSQEGKKRRRVKMGIEINPAEAEIVKLIFNLYVSGYGSTRICKILNNPPNNYRRRNGKPFDHTLILNIIKNPIYMGVITWGKTTYRDKYFKRTPKQDWTFSDPVEKFIIVDRQTWEAAQQILTERSQQVRKGKTFSRRSLTNERLLTGLAFCGYCGEPLLSHTYKKGDYRLKGYVCRSQKRKSPCNSRFGFWRADELDNLIRTTVVNSFEKLFSMDNMKLFEKVKEEYNKTLRTDIQATTRLEHDIKRMKLQKDYYVKQFNCLLAGDKVNLPEEVIREQLFKIQEQLEDAENRFEALSRDITREPIDEVLLASIITDLRSWDKVLLAADIPVQKSMLQQVVDSIIVYDTEIQIKLTYSLHDMLFNISPSLASAVPDCWGSIPVQENIEYIRKKKARPAGREYWHIVQDWESKTGKPFGEIIAELRLKQNLSPEEVIKKLGVSKGFLYYHFSDYMDRISYLQRKYDKTLGEVILEMRKDKTMTEIAETLGLSVSCLYLHLRKLEA